MRNISFALTTQQIRAGTKTVTRRLGWRQLLPGVLLSPVLKGMGLRKGEKIERLRGPLVVVDVRRERLDRLITDPAYGFREVKLEGFGDDPSKGWPDKFVEFFCETHGCKPRDYVTRIEFAYTDKQPVSEEASQ